jgi:hypothetical protein
VDAIKKAQAAREGAARRMKLKLNQDAKVFYPVVAVVFALRIALDIQHGHWTFAKEFLDFLDKLSPCVLIGLGVAFFWNLFRRKTN